jgi:hypothetical protein
VSGDAPELVGRVHQNLHLRPGADEVQALLTVDATGSARPAPEAAEVIAVDVSRSMGEPAEKLRRAIEATGAAIDALRDGVHFAVVAGSHEARVVYPARPGTERAGARTRAEAKEAVAHLVAGGGTAIGTWLRLIRALLAGHPGAIRHAILLTDGRDEHESADDLAAAVAACEGVFRCDARGVGDDWSAAELRDITRALLGSADLVPHPAAMAADFRALMAASMRKQVADVALRVWTPVGARVLLVKQTSPDVIDLTAGRVDADEQVGTYPTGAWGTEERDFHVSLSVPAAAVGQERLACRLSFVRALPGGGVRPLEQAFVRTRPNGTRETHAEALVSAIWTDDPGRDTAPHPLVLASLDQDAVEAAVDRVAAAFRSGDHVTAGQWLDDIRPRAEQAGMSDLVARIDGLRDAETGTYEIDPAGLLGIEIESSRLPPSPRTGERRRGRRP